MADFKIQPDQFSFFNAPISNVKPARTLTTEEVACVVGSDELREQTLCLRRLVRQKEQGATTKKEVQAYKAAHLPCVTWSALCSRRRATGVVSHSENLCLDIDDMTDWQAADTPLKQLHPEWSISQLQGVEGLRYALCRDKELDCRLIFRSPSGTGLKVVCAIDLSAGTHRRYYEALAYYLLCRYGVEVDAACSDVVRACYLCWDPDVYYASSQNL